MPVTKPPACLFRDGREGRISNFRFPSGFGFRASKFFSFFSLVLLCAFYSPAMVDPSGKETVGRKSDHRIITPVNQAVTPAGASLDLPGMRPQALALSPDGRFLVTAGKTHDLVVIDPATRQVRQRVALPAEPGANPSTDPVSSQILKPDVEGQVSYTGLVFSPDGTRIYLSNVGGSIKVFVVKADHSIAGLGSFPLPPANAPRRKDDIPAGLAISRDGKKLYVALNLSNRLVALDTATGKLLGEWETGVAPYDVVLARGKAYVSNWGGRRPEPGSLVGPAGRGTTVRVDPVHHVASEGSVTVIDLNAGNVIREIPTGLHASGLVRTPDARYVLVANAGSDTISVIDTRRDQVVETIWARQSPADLFGASPNALAMDESGKTLYVCNGTQNAVAVVAFSPGRSRRLGLIPAGWFPGAIACDAARNSLYVANLKGIGSGRPRKSNAKPEFNSHQYYGSIDFIPVPRPAALAEFTRQAEANMRYPRLAQAALPARAGQRPRPVPERVGEPSVFKHVIYIIKENRTYDQVLGDLPSGNGDPELCVFGRRVTPNQHQLVADFVLLDNTYCSGILSADGHQWATTAFATDYMEKSFAGFPRSYPDGMGDDEIDALAYSPAGFIWDNALAHGKTFRDYGEFAITRKSWKDQARKGTPDFLDFYRQVTNGTDTISLFSEPGVETLRPHLATNTVGWDLEVPDVFRAAQFIKDLERFERDGHFPELVLICLPNDHTSGTKPGCPTPAAMVADNDLAFGRIVEAVSHSSFWKDTCILAMEDDPQAGWDHVSGYRTTAYVISPYSRRGKVVSTQYNQTSVLRTIELILGLPPMNQFDATATPMSDCFGDAPDLKPYAALPNNVALDEMNPEPKKVTNAALRKDALVSARLPLAKPDQCPESVLNRILWRAAKGPDLPYPAWAIQERDDD